MKKLTLAAALLAATPLFAAKLTETIDRTFDVRPGAEVKLTNVNGGITVTSWDQPRVRVVAEKTVKGDKSDAQEAIKELRVEFQQRDGGLVVTTHYPDDDSSGFFKWLSGDDVDASVRYELTVPRSMNLDISDTNGSIRVTEVTGRLELDTTNGRIEAKRCAGSIDASTTNGGIVAELLRVTPGQPLTLSTTNGAIDIALPQNFAGEVDAGTTNGAITTDLPVATTRVGDNRLRGTINGGGTALKLRTTNGAIEISKAGS
jgi:DUF4097 and DUF4098 domain-containing protein YvlB